MRLVSGKALLDDWNHIYEYINMILDSIKWFLISHGLGFLKLGPTSGAQHGSSGRERPEASKEQKWKEWRIVGERNKDLDLLLRRNRKKFQKLLAELSSYFENSEKRQVEETDSNNLLYLIQQTSNTSPIKSEWMESAFNIPVALGNGPRDVLP